MLLCLNPFEIRISFEPMKYRLKDQELQSQSLRNQGFVRTEEDFEDDEREESQSLRNQGFIRTDHDSPERAVCKSQSLRNQGFIRTGIRAIGKERAEVSIPSKSGFHSNIMTISKYALRVRSQSLRNQGFIRTYVERGRRRSCVSIPSKSGFHSN